MSKVPQFKDKKTLHFLIAIPASEKMLGWGIQAETTEYMARPTPAKSINGCRLRFPSAGGEMAQSEIGWFQPGALTVLEERGGTAVAIPTAFELLDTRTFGNTNVRLLRVQP